MTSCHYASREQSGSDRAYQSFKYIRNNAVGLAKGLRRLIGGIFNFNNLSKTKQKLDLNYQILLH